jgi:hypothetical protein
MNEPQRVDVKSLARLAEATVSRRKLDATGIRAIIERMRNVDLPTKKDLLQGAIASVQALLETSKLTAEEQKEIEGVLTSLQEEASTVDALLARRKNESAQA